MTAPGDAFMTGLRARIDELEWYHTLELAPGVVTPGWFDLRSMPERVGLPASLAGRRCLDVGTFDGFWAFEMEKRGAAEVVAVDLLDPRQWDWPAGSQQQVMDAIGARKGRGEGFLVARDALGSEVTRLERSVYDLDPGDLGAFDYVYVGSLLLHLRDPVGGLARVRSVCRGDALVVDAVSALLSTVVRRRPVAMLDAVGRPWWWKPNAAAVARMAEAAGFRVDGTPKRVAMPPGKAQEALRIPWSKLARGQGLRSYTSGRGDPHVAVRLVAH